MAEEKRVKYGILVFPNLQFFPKDGFHFGFSSSEHLVVESVKDTFKSYEEKHWAEWIGSIAWEQFSKGKVQLQVWISSERPDVIDQENQDIQTSLIRYNRALMLCELLTPPYERPLIVTGLGKIEGGRLVPLDIRTFGKSIEWLVPEYVKLDEYRNSGPWKAIAGQAPHCYGKQFFETWQKRAAQLKAIDGGEENFLRNLGMYSFQRSLGEQVLDFNYPNLVRAIETLVALSPDQGRSFFAKRAIRFMPPLEKLMLSLSEKDISKILKVSYGLRSDSVHGKPFAWGIGSQRTELLKAEINRYVYVLETLARNTIVAFLDSTELAAASKDRKTLEDYWNKIDPPPEQKKCEACGQAIRQT